MRRRRRGGGLAIVAVCAAVIAGMVAPCGSLAAAAEPGGEGTGSTASRPADATAVVLGVGAGAMSVDLPDPDNRGETYGTNPRVSFEIGGEARPWLEFGLDLGFTMLGESDSMNAVLASQGIRGTAVVTHVQATIGTRVRWLHGGSRWAPCARAGAGVASQWISAPGGFGEHTSDPAWLAGAGLEVYAHRRVLVRAEAVYVGQATEASVRHHAAATLSVLYAVSRRALATAP